MSLTLIVFTLTNCLQSATVIYLLTFIRSCLSGCALRRSIGWLKRRYCPALELVRPPVVHVRAATAAERRRTSASPCNALAARAGASADATVVTIWKPLRVPVPISQSINQSNSRTASRLNRNYRLAKMILPEYDFHSGRVMHRWIDLLRSSCDDHGRCTPVS